MAGDASSTCNDAIAEPKRHSFFVGLFIRLVKEKPLGTIGLAIVLVLLLTGIFADLLAPSPHNGKTDPDLHTCCSHHQPSTGSARITWGETS